MLLPVPWLRLLLQQGGTPSYLSDKGLAVPRGRCLLLLRLHHHLALRVSLAHGTPTDAASRDHARSLLSVFLNGVLRLPGRVSLLQLLIADPLRPPRRTEVVSGIGSKLYAESCKSACCMPCISSIFSVLSLRSPSASACFCLRSV